jgi:lipoprotein signal peptidase
MAILYTVFMKRKAVSKIISDCGVFVKRQFEGLSLQKAFGYLGIEVAFILLFLAADLLTKRYVYGGMVASGKDIIIIKEVLRLTPVQNTGASFGIFQGHTDILSVVSVVTLFFVAVFMIFSLKNRN